MMVLERRQMRKCEIFSARWMRKIYVRNERSKSNEWQRLLSVLHSHWPCLASHIARLNESWLYRCRIMISRRVHEGFINLKKEFLAAIIRVVMSFEIRMDPRIYSLAVSQRIDKNSFFNSIAILQLVKLLLLLLLFK